jgi:L-fuculose-phosphate aldolase
MRVEGKNKGRWVLGTGTVTLTGAQERLLSNIALASRILSLTGHDDLNQGQVSARLPGSGGYFIKNATCGFNETTPGTIVPASLEPDVKPHRLVPPELPLHHAIYRARPDVNAIVHSHSPYALIFGALDLEIRPVSHDGAYFTGRLPRYTRTSHTVLEDTIGNEIASALGPCPAILLRNHGAVIAGRSIREACVLAQLLERACMIQVIAESTRVPYHHSSPEDVAKKRDYIYSDTAIKTYWEYGVRTVKERWPEASDWK